MRLAGVNLEKDSEDQVPVIVDLRPEIEAGLLAQARAEGLPLDEFLTRKLEALAHANRDVPRGSGNAAEWEKDLEEWLDSFPRQVSISDDALKRENWYPDRW